MDIDIEQLIQPLDGEPCGVDAANLESFDFIEAEVAKGEGLDREFVDWTRIVKSSSEILSTQSKHMQVAAYLTYGLLKEDGYKGLANGLAAFKGMVEADYWETIYPTRPKKPGKLKARPMAWLSSKLSKEFALLEMNEESDIDGILSSIDNFLGLDNAIANRLENDAPNVLEFVANLRRVKQEAQAWKQQIDSKAEEEQKRQQEEEDRVAAEAEAAAQKQAASETTATTTASPAPAQAPSVTAPETPSFSAVSKDNIEKALKATQKTLFQLSEHFQSIEPYSANAMYLSRVAGWMIFQKAPVTGVLPQNPGDETFSRLESLLEEGENEKLLETAENLFKNGTVIHLGLQRLVVQALQAMKNEDAASAVKGSLMQLIGRAPDWMENKFLEGTPFVDEKTKAWMESELAGGNGEVAVADKGSASGWSVAAAQAKLHLVNNETSDGIQVFEDGINTVSSQRERVYWRLEQAKFALKAGELNMAVNQLEYLNRLMTENHLSEWEPELKGEIVKSLVEAHQGRMAKQQYAPEQIKALEQLKQELYVFDPLAAMSFEQGKK